VVFPEGPTFAVLDSLDASWPTDEPKRKLGSDRTPAGWRFLGYRFDDERVPTFRYLVGSVEIAETFSTRDWTERAFLKRRLVLRRTTDSRGGRDGRSLYLRVAVGKEIVAKDGKYVVDGRFVYRVRSTPESASFVRHLESQTELLTPIQSISTGAETSVEVELEW